MQGNASAIDIIGSSVALRTNRSLTAETGAVGWTGQDAELVETIPTGLAAGNGAFGVDGVAARLQVSRRMLAEPGELVSDATTSDLRISRTLPASFGTLALDAIEPELRISRVLSGENGAFVSTGQDAGLEVAAPSDVWTFSDDLITNIPADEGWTFDGDLIVSIPEAA